MSLKSHHSENKYIEPLSDIGFKILFGRESSRDILIGFLNAVLDTDGKDPITELTYLDKEKPMESTDGRSIAYDIHCKTETGHRFIVEMQNKPQKYFKERTVFYVARAITEQGEPGNWNYNFMPVYAIAISQFKLDPNDQRVRVDAILADTQTHKQFSDSMRLIYIQLPNFTIQTPEECMTDFDRWIYILKNMRDMETMPFVQDIFRRVEQVASVENLNADDRRRYERDLKFYRDYHNTIDYAKEQGLAEGRAEGRAKGREEGRAEGRAEGIKNTLKKTALAMKSKGFDIPEIAELLDLSEEEVRSLL